MKTKLFMMALTLVVLGVLLVAPAAQAQATDQTTDQNTYATPPSVSQGTTDNQAAAAALPSAGNQAATALGTVSQSDLDANLANWNDAPRNLASGLVAKYGLPNEMTASSLIWYNNGCWKRTVLVNEPICHNFPSPHSDYLYQTVSYRVPANKVSALTEFDGSLSVSRTRGELTSGEDCEAHNIVMINVANDIVTGRRNANEARKFASDTILRCKHPSYACALRICPNALAAVPDKMSGNVNDIRRNCCSGEVACCPAAAAICASCPTPCQTCKVCPDQTKACPCPVATCPAPCPAPCPVATCPAPCPAPVATCPAPCPSTCAPPSTQTSGLPPTNMYF